MDAMLWTNGCSAYQMHGRMGAMHGRTVFGSNPADNFGWGGEDGDLFVAQDTSLSGHFVSQ